MILKILLTLAVIAAVYAWFRTKNTKQLNDLMIADRQLANHIEVKKTLWVKPLLYSLGGLVILVSVLLFYFSWVDDNTQYQVTITNPQSGVSETFVALKKDMRGRLFITQSGREIWVSDLERIEIRKLNSENLSSGNQ